MQTTRRSYALPKPEIVEAALFATVTVALTLPFWWTDLDIQAASLFFHPEQAPNLWPEEQQGLWVFLYKAIPILANLSLLSCLAALAFSGAKPRARRSRRLAFFVLFSIMLGPGLVVNGIFKDHYGRPRPRQIEQFQGHLSYQPPGMPGAEGKSFPCGHCSVGFSLWVFYFISRRRKPLRATAILAASIGFGLLVGLGRMAAGGHFLSDVLWSGILSYAVCALLYYPLVGKWEKLPDEEVPEFFLLAYWQNLPAPMRPWLLASLAVFVSVVASLATPHKTQQTQNLPTTTNNSQTPLVIDAQVGDVALRQANENMDAIRARWSFKGFGFPTSHIDAHYDPERHVFIIAKNGLFTDL